MNAFHPSQQEGVGGLITNKGLLANQWMVVQIFDSILKHRPTFHPDIVAPLAVRVTNLMIEKLDYNIEPIHQGDCPTCQNSSCIQGEFKLQ